MTDAAAGFSTRDSGVLRTHPPGLAVLFATEMWERFSFYSMLALFTLYLQDRTEGFAWSAESATRLYSNYMMFVYASPLIGGFLADRKLGYRRSVLIGGCFFMAGHLLLSVRSMPVVYLALTCLVIGNGFFKPNVSIMVGNLYPDGSRLKDRAYNIFYMGINMGAFLAPVVMELVKRNWGNHIAFTVAAFGMVLSLTVLTRFRRLVEDPAGSRTASHSGDTVEPTRDSNPINAVPDLHRVLALSVIYMIVVVFWMVAHQNGSTLTYWADENTRWNVSGTISNAINPFWVVALTFPLVALWKALDRRGIEPSTPMKMTVGMALCGTSFFVLHIAARVGERAPVTPELYAVGTFRVSERSLQLLAAAGMPTDLLNTIGTAVGADGKSLVRGVKFKPSPEGSGRDALLDAIATAAGPEAVARHGDVILRHSYLFRVSWLWLVGAYAILTAGELLLSPMGLSLVSKVAPTRLRGVMMGGWFVATAIGNKLTMIGVYWGVWQQSTFFAVLGSLALLMSALLLCLQRPLRSAMPGV